ncbi:MAG TPA: type II toxin-antitoxin system RelE/ParE family toxin [Opitutaceae bacterium]
MKLRILRSAFDDIAKGRQFYDERAPGIGDYFFDSVFSDIDSLMLYAGIHRIEFGFHRLLTRRFPVAVYYRIIAREVVVFRVLDCRRDPGAIRKALGER